MKKILLILFCIWAFTATASAQISWDQKLLKIEGEPENLYSIYVYRPVSHKDLISSFMETYDRSDLLNPMTGQVSLKDILADATTVMTNKQGIATYSLPSLPAGLYNIEVIGEENNPPKTLLFGKDTHLFFEGNSVDTLSDSRFKIVLANITARTIEDITAAHTNFLSLESKENAIRLMEKNPSYFCAAVFLQKAMELPSASESVLKVLKQEINGLGWDTKPIDLLQKNVKYGEATHAVLNSNYNGMEQLLENLKEISILYGIKNVINYKDAKIFLAESGNLRYQSGTIEQQNAIADKVSGNNYPSIELLNRAIDGLSLEDRTPGNQGGGNGGNDSKSPLASMHIRDSDTKPASVVDFEDVSITHWGYPSIAYMKEKGIIEGYEGKFYPDNQITRAEFVKILCNSFGIAAKNGLSFQDVSESDWFVGYLFAAYELGLIQGAEGNFMPHQQITRQDAAVMLVRFAEYKGLNWEDGGSPFADEEEIADYAKEAVGKMSHAKILQGVGDNRFAPRLSTTRAAAAKMIHETQKAGGLKE